jgi:hypothetical protein
MLIKRKENERNITWYIIAYNGASLGNQILISLHFSKRISDAFTFFSN